MALSLSDRRLCRTVIIKFEQKALEVLRSGWYILGNEVKEFAAYTGAKHCVGLASGLDALWIAFRVLGIGSGDEVIV